MKHFHLCIYTFHVSCNGAEDFVNRLNYALVTAEMAPLINNDRISSSSQVTFILLSSKVSSKPVIQLRVVNFKFFLPSILTIKVLAMLPIRCMSPRMHLRPQLI